MDTVFYSPGVGGFYLRELHGGAIPADAVEITAEEHAALLAGNAAGLVIAPDAEGRPTLIEPPPSPPAPPIRVIRSLAFRMRLPEAKRTAVTVAAHAAAAAGQGALLTFLLDQASSVLTDLDDPRVVAGVDALRAAGLITAAERTALLANGTPDEAT